MEWLLEPLTASFVQRAVIGGALVAVFCAVVGTWVVVRGMAFLGDAMAHGLLPGIAIASLLGGNLVIGAAVSAAATAAGVSVITRNRRVSQDTAIGLLFVVMLSLGVILVSASGFAVDLTGTLFGDVLAVGMDDIAVLSIVGAVVLTTAAVFHRAFSAAAFNQQKAASLGLRPRLTHFVLLCLITLAVAASFQVVGTLLVFGLLIAPPAAALVWAKSIRAVMVIGSLIGAASVVVGLWVSWYASTAAGASIALVAAVSYFVSASAAAITGKRLPQAGFPPSFAVSETHSTQSETELLARASRHV